jgi:Fatty acid synthesis protein
VAEPGRLGGGAGEGRARRDIIVALDGRGAERGAEAVVAGAREAAGAGIRLRVFGDREDLAGLDGVAGIELVEAAGEISNDEEPVRAVRSKPEASVVLAAADVAAGRSQALVSAGSTGATMTAALFALRRLQGVRRPALAVQIVVPGREGPPIVMLDVGANVDARASAAPSWASLGRGWPCSPWGRRPGRDGQRSSMRTHPSPPEPASTSSATSRDAICSLMRPMWSSPTGSPATSP